MAHTSRPVYTSQPAEKPQTRRDRYADNVLDWVTPDQLPSEPMWTVVKASPSPAGFQRKVLFNGRMFLTTEAISAWRPAPPDDNLVSRLLDNGRGHSPLEGLEILELESLPVGDERATLAKLAEMELDVEVVRLYQVTPDTHGMSSGKVVAVSERFAAQDIGQDGLLIVEQDRLNRRMYAGQNATVDFIGGQGTVYSGLMYEVNVTAPFLSKDQVGWLRKMMVEALSQTPGAPDDEAMIKGALQYALADTIRTYGLDKTVMPKARVNLSVRDTIGPQQLVAQQEADAAAQRERERLQVLDKLLPAPVRNRG